MEIRRSYDRLISTMGFPILVRWHLYIESGPWFLCNWWVLLLTAIMPNAQWLLLWKHLLCLFKCGNAGASCVNSLRPSDAYVRHQNRPTLVQIKVCRLISTKPLFDTRLAYCQLDHWEIYLSEIRIKMQQFYWRKWLWKCRLQSGAYFVSA